MYVSLGPVSPFYKNTHQIRLRAHLTTRPHLNKLRLRGLYFQKGHILTLLEIRIETYGFVGDTTQPVIDQDDME